MQKLLSVHYIYLIPLLPAALVSLKSIWQKWPDPFRQFALFLWLTLFVEAFAIAWKWYLHKTPYWNFTQANIWIYDLFAIIKTIFFMWFFSHLFREKKVARAIKIASVPVLLFGVIEYSLTNTPITATVYTILLGNIIIVILSLLYFREILQEAPSVSLQNNPAIIIVTGALLYHSATTPFFLYMNVLNASDQTLSSSYIIINHAFNVIMYSLFLTSFLCKPPFRK